MPGPASWTGGGTAVKAAAGMTGWELLAQKIRSGDPMAPTEFKETYLDGVRLLLQRALGFVTADRLVEETLDGAIAEIRQGGLPAQTDLLSLVRGVIARARKNMDSSTPACARQDLPRIRQRSLALGHAKENLSPPVRRAVELYYNGADLGDALSQTGVSREDFDDACAQLRSTGGGALRKGPAADLGNLARRLAAAR